MIYVDELLILNFVMDYIIIDFTSNVLKINGSFKRKILSCIFGELSLLYLFININNYVLFIFKILIGIFMILIAFGYGDVKTFIKNSLYFYSFNFLLGGTLYFFKVQNIVQYEIFIFITPIIMNIYKYLSYNLRNIITTKHRVTIYLNNGKILYFNGHMDTGNNLIDPLTNKKVIIINKKIDEDYILVPYRTIDNESLIKCFKPRKVYIDGIGERKDILVGMIDKKFIGFNCLLNYTLMEEQNVRKNIK